MSTENNKPGADSENIEVCLLLEAMFLKYGYDFRDYSRAHVKRRILHVLSACGLESISEMQHRVLHERSFFETLLQGLSVNVTEMFRAPSFFRAVRRMIVPALVNRPFIRVWHPGCATGEEVYSMAIALKEEGLYEKTQMYATDFNQVVVQRARTGIYPIDLMQGYTQNYHKAGGTASFADYYTARYDAAIMDESLKKQIAFADHNLVTDGVFGEMDMIVCRNVLIYFNRALQDRVIGLFADSLRPGGFFCLGPKESLNFSTHARLFEPLVPEEKIYVKKSGE